MSERDKEYVLSKQVLRSGTAIGALIREAQQAETKPDFVHKLGIALKEAEETQYWLELLQAAEYMNTREFESLNGDLKEVHRGDQDDSCPVEGRLSGPGVRWLSSSRPPDVN